MSTTPINPDQNQLLSEIHQSFSSLSHRTLTLSYGLVATLVLVLALAGFGGYIQYKMFQGAMAKAEAQEQLYKTQLEAFKQDLAQHDAQRQVDAQRISDLQAQINRRANTPPPPVISEGLKAAASTENVIKALIAAYGPEMTPSTVNDNMIALSVPNAQETISAKVNLDRDEADIQDYKGIIGAQSASISSLNNDLHQCNDLLGTANKTIADYKKAANKTKWQKFLQGAEKVLIGVGGFALGHAL